MKRMLFILFALGIAVSTTAMTAMSSNRVSRQTLFLTDKMAYELGLNNAQYNDVYEINYDFVNKVTDIMDDVACNEDWALDEYGEALDIRNDDLRWVLSSSQYNRFLNIDYFCRPMYTSGNSWNFSIYLRYTNPNLFYYDRPNCYTSYFGSHYRNDFYATSYYRNRFNGFDHCDRPFRMENHGIDFDQRNNNYANRSFGYNRNDRESRIYSNNRGYNDNRGTNDREFGYNRNFDNEHSNNNRGFSIGNNNSGNDRGGMHSDRRPSYGSSEGSGFSIGNGNTHQDNFGNNRQQSFGHNDSSNFGEARHSSFSRSDNAPANNGGGFHSSRR